MVGDAMVYVCRMELAKLSERVIGGNKNLLIMLKIRNSDHQNDSQDQTSPLLHKKAKGAGKFLSSPRTFSQLAGEIINKNQNNILSEDTVFLLMDRFAPS
ncbi:hypothetical protein LIER_31767 [Lithospermum erythrorhizon]|uniref:Uncharacterized protein n=1 Tax=Lithospermum erythrorhizon TaxID=34254 RepID=A0AAV3RSP1_LITER